MWILLNIVRLNFYVYSVHIKIHLATPEHHVNQMSSYGDQPGSGGSGGGDEHIEITSPGGGDNRDHNFSGDFNHGGNSGGSYGSGGYGFGTGLSGGHRSIGYGDGGRHTSNGYEGGHSSSYSGSFGSSNGGSRPDFGSAGFSGSYAESGQPHGKGKISRLPLVTIA